MIDLWSGNDRIMFATDCITPLENRAKQKKHCKIKT